MRFVPKRPVVPKLLPSLSLGLVIFGIRRLVPLGSDSGFLVRIANGYSETARSYSVLHRIGWSRLVGSAGMCGQ
ncbi:hypothetical protein C8F01DRAFT_1167523 [Mycena amicta]|nr:hypothetical protein C8F01DRAFT_1167523 [Mycena amicta]